MCRVTALVTVWRAGDAVETADRVGDAASPHWMFRSDGSDVPVAGL